MPLLRLDKLLADAGLGTRTDVKKLIKSGRVTVNGKVIRDNGCKTDTEDDIKADGRTVEYRRYVYLMLNKPSGVVSATEDKRERTVTDILKPPYSNMGLFPAGRLDKDTVGLIILTNDGEFAHNTLSPKKHVAKTYYVEASGNFSDDIKVKFKEGIALEDGYVCKSADITFDVLEKTRVKAYITITEGKFHQIKRMFKAVGGSVTYLKRISFGKIKLDEGLAEGEYRPLNDAELSYAASFRQE